jgi:uncharacterized protein YutE (UPF0331/DUF86 family)
MTPARLHESVISGRVRWIRDMIGGIRSLPLGSFEEFIADGRSPAAAESYLRRALEAILDLGRHILAKAMGKAVPEYKDIARELKTAGVITPETAEILLLLAGYRNRMVHFYHEIGASELYDICVNRSGDIERVLADILDCLGNHPDIIDTSL